MTDLTNQRIRSTYGRLLQIADDGVDGDLRAVLDGKGDATALLVSNTAV